MAQQRTLAALRAAQLLRATMLVTAYVALACTLAGCHTSAATPPAHVETPRAAEPETPAHPPITLPECDAANGSASEEQAAFFEAFGADRITARYGETDRALFDEFASPAALAAAEDATQQRSCNWVVYLDSVYLYQSTAELPQSAMAPLVAELRASDFSEEQLGQATMFASAYVTDDMRGTIGISHTFIGDVWITLIENSALGYEQSAVDAMIAANPWLADPDPGPCAEQPAAEPIARGAAKIAPREDLTAPGIVGGWDVALAAELGKNTYDACAPLSWALLPAAHAHGDRQTHTMLFHYGDFVGTDTEHGVSPRPAVTRLTASSISATYRWQIAGDAAASGRAVSKFTWNESTAAIVREGELPPERADR